MWEYNRKGQKNQNYTSKEFWKNVFFSTIVNIKILLYDMIFIGILVTLLLFSVVVLVHEYGHYKVAKYCKIEVEEFWLWIPPRAKKLWKDKDGTLFSLNWIPLWGFVKIAGENEFAKQSKKGRNFHEKNIWQKTWVLIAGVVMNIILTFFIFLWVFLYGVTPIGINTVFPITTESRIIPTLSWALDMGLLIQEPGIVLMPLEKSYAQQNGILSWDILLRVNSQLITDISILQELIKNSPNQTLFFEGERFTKECREKNSAECREKENFSISLTVPETGKIGTYLSMNYVPQKDFILRYWFLESLKAALGETFVQIHLTFAGLKYLWGNIISPETPEMRQEAIEQVSWPIGVVSVVTQTLDQWIIFFLILTALISVNLAVFNILPIPALDGGRIAALWIRSGVEKIFGKTKIGVKIENSLHIFFFILLILVSILIAYNDILKF